MAEYISREEVMSVIANMQVEHHYDGGNLEDRYVVAHLLEVADKIKELKSTDVQPVKRGRWEYSEKEYGECAWYFCSFCDEPAEQLYNDETLLSEFCPHCGAKMMKDGDT